MRSYITDDYKQILSLMPYRYDRNDVYFHAKDYLFVYDGRKLRPVDREDREPRIILAESEIERLKEKYQKTSTATALAIHKRQAHAYDIHNYVRERFDMGLPFIIECHTTTSTLSTYRIEVDPTTNQATAIKTGRVVNFKYLKPVCPDLMKCLRDSSLSSTLRLTLFRFMHVEVKTLGEIAKMPRVMPMPIYYPPPDLSFKEKTVKILRE